MSDLQAVTKEISELAEMVSSETTPHLRIFNLSQRYFEATKAAKPSASALYINMQLAILWKRSLPWVQQHMTFRNLHPDLLPRLEKQGNMRLPLMVAVKLSRHPKEAQEAILKRLNEELRGAKVSGSANNLLDALRRLNDQTFGTQVKRRKCAFKEVEIPEVKPVMSFEPYKEFVRPPTRNPAPVLRPVSPVPIVSDLSTEDSELASVRAFFTLKDYQPSPKKTDLQPLPQPREWDPEKTERVVRGVRIRDE